MGILLPAIVPARGSRAALLITWMVALLAPARSEAAEPAAPAPVSAEGASLGHLPWAAFSGGEPGTWVEYASLVGGYPVAPYLRLLLLGTEKVDGGDGTWLEIWISQRPGSATQAFRLLVSGDPSRPGGIRKAQVRLLGGRVQDVAPEDLLPSDPATPHDAAAPRPRVQGETASILTPAGSFESRLATLGKPGRDTRLWLSPAVPIFGLVRLEIAGRTGLELHALGTGGRGVVEGEPAPVDPKKPRP